MRPVRRLRAGARELLGRWPRLGLAVRTALAAGLAWWIALRLPFTPAETYPYYAPLGAVVGSYSTVRSSARNSLLAVLAIVVGAVLALAAAAVAGGVLVVLLLVFVATLVAGWRLLGEQRSWVLTASLFVLVVGAADPVDYVSAYAGLTLLGGLVAVVVNAALPEVPLSRSHRELHRLAGVLADQLDDLAEGLRRDEPPSAQEWEQRLRSIAPVRESARASGAETEESLRGNLRARRNLPSVRRQHVDAVVLDNLGRRVEELTELLVEVQTPGERAVAMDAALRWPTAQALSSLAALLRERPEEIGAPDAAPPDVTGLREDVQRLSQAQVAAEYTTDRDRQTAGAVVTLLRRCLGALQVDPTVPDPEAVAPTPWAQPDPRLPGRPRLRPRTGGRWRVPTIRRR